MTTLTKDELIDILERNQENIEKGDWNSVYENMGKYDRGQFSDFLIENGIDPNTMFIYEIPDYAFGFCHSLTSIKILDGVTKIGSNAFWDCISLTSVTIPNTITEIGRRAFGDCRSLTSITIPEGVKEIGEHVFWECSKLKSVTIPHSVKKIGDWAFYGCGSLSAENITYDGTLDEFLNISFNEIFDDGLYEDGEIYEKMNFLR